MADKRSQFVKQVESTHCGKQDQGATLERVTILAFRSKKDHNRNSDNCSQYQK